MPVTLRTKPIKNGQLSYFLDITGHGRRKKKTLKIFILENPKTNIEKNENKEKKRRANAIRSKTELELVNNEHGLKNKDKSHLSFYEVIKQKSEDFSLAKSSKKSYTGLITQMLRFSNTKNLTLKDIDEVFVRKFLNYIKSYCSESTVNQRLTIIRAVLKFAVDKKYISIHPLKSIKYLKEKKVEREYLTIEEIQLVANANCRNPVLKKMFIFCCYTGLRRSDVFALRWSDIKDIEGVLYIRIDTIKTNSDNIIKLHELAESLIGERQRDNDLVFQGISDTSSLNDTIRAWMRNAGIAKEITFHCSRHSFATNLAIMGVSIEVTSKLLGHKKLSTTEIYYRVVDQLRVRAVELLPMIELKETNVY